MYAVRAKLPTKFGMFEIRVWPAQQGQEPVALLTPNLNPAKPVLVRVHSECLTGDAFGSLRCDCGTQKDRALQLIRKSGNGVLLYLRQEGRGIGLYEKIKSYKLQERGIDTHEANILLGHKPDAREYSWARRMLHSLRITKIKLLTNNPSKVHALCVPGLQCVSILPLAVQSNPCNRRYIKTKREKFNHYGFRPQPYYGISGIRRVADLRGAIIAAKHLSKGRESITVGIPCSAALLNSLLACEKIATLFRHARRAGLTPVLHFSFTKNYSAELRGIRQTMPFVKHLQLNDLPTPDLKTLEFATSHFHVVLPLSPKQVCAATRSFLQLIKRTGTTILLDKSKGKGKTQLVKE
ncbi:MAG TPA: GTP cyclohydrolase II, partial [Candidatus Nanoarchaeia archaeon]|nr:GTP cyclohydrolase II [Candidatus Nanoarchaeia archaeon]